MTITYDPRSPGIGDDTEDGVTHLCEACGHQKALHDTTAVRFCGATLNRSLSRGCLCGSLDQPPALPMHGRGRYSGRDAVHWDAVRPFLVAEEYLELSIDTMLSKWGSIENYWAAAGVDAAGLARLRDALLEE